MEYDAPGDPYEPTKKLIDLTLQNILSAANKRLRPHAFEWQVT